MHIRDTVRPHLGALQSRRVTGTAVSGDATFAIDDIAEEAILEFVEREKLSIAYYSEDKGLMEFGESPEAVLVIDPIDGTRPAVAGFETCVVSVAWADYTDTPKMKDVRYGCVAELKLNDLFFAERGEGVEWINGAGRRNAPRLLPAKEIRETPLSFEVVARPFQYLAPCMAEIVDTAGMKGGCFVFNSTAFSLTRLITGQLGGVLDIANRILRDYPQTRDTWVAAGNGKIVSLFTYDIAAAALIASEAGAVVTNAYGQPFTEVSLLDTSESNLQTICAASNPEIHRKLLDAIDRGIASLIT